jgi:hypothetical protein
LDATRKALTFSPAFQASILMQPDLADVAAIREAGKHPAINHLENDHGMPKDSDKHPGAER